MSNLFAARLMGALILISTSSYMAASNLLMPVFQLPDFLNHVFLNKNTLSLAALLEFVNSAAIVLASIVIYPIIKQYSERIALSYVAFRIIEAVLLLAGAVLILTIVNMGEKLAAANDVELLRELARGLVSERFYYFQIAMLALSLCGLMLCAALFRYKMVPRLLSVLGISGYAILLAKVVMDFFDIDTGGQLLFIPGALFELFLPLWLFAKGFDTRHMPKAAAA